MEPVFSGAPLSSRPIYTRQQILQYFTRINLPIHELESSIATSFDASSASPSEALRFLTVLHRHNLAAIPFENLALHYSVAKVITLDPADVFHKMVERNTGRGGYCMENNCLFGTVLRSLKYKVVSYGARVDQTMAPRKPDRPQPRFSGWNHMLNVVTIEDKRFWVETGFSSSAPAGPLELVPDVVRSNIGTQNMRLLYGPLEQHTDSTQRAWQYQVQSNKDSEWVPMLCFVETEFFPEDFEMMNHHTSTSRLSIFTANLICVKMIMDPESGEIVGDWTLWNSLLKKRMYSVSEKVAEYTSEQERLKGLEEIFGITLDVSEKRGIRGTVSDLTWK